MTKKDSRYLPLYKSGKPLLIQNIKNRSTEGLRKCVVVTLLMKSDPRKGPDISSKQFLLTFQYHYGNNYPQKCSIQTRFCPIDGFKESPNENVQSIRENCRLSSCKYFVFTNRLLPIADPNSSIVERDLNRARNSPNTMAFCLCKMLYYVIISFSAFVYEPAQGSRAI